VNCAARSLYRMYKAVVAPLSLTLPRFVWLLIFVAIGLPGLLFLVNVIAWLLSRLQTEAVSPFIYLLG